MNYGVSATDTTPRKDVIREAISIIVTTLGKEDSQAKHEASGGGLRTVTFAGGQAHDIDDLNPRNLRDKWAKIKWAGGTRIMPGLYFCSHLILLNINFYSSQKDGPSCGIPTWRSLVLVIQASGHF